MTDNTQPEALRLAQELDAVPETGADPDCIQECATALRRQHARIADLEAQLEAIGAGGVNGPLMGQSFDAADMASASAQGFRDGVASLAANAGSEPVAPDGWLHENGLLYRLTDERHPCNRDEINVTMADGSRSIESRSRRALELLDRIRATHPSPPEGMVMVPKDALSKCKVALERYSQVPPKYHNSVLRLRDSMRELLLAAWVAAPPTSSADSRKGG